MALRAWFIPATSFPVLHNKTKHPFMTKIWKKSSHVLYQNVRNFALYQLNPNLIQFRTLVWIRSKDIHHNLELMQCTQKPSARFCSMGILLISFIQLTLIKSIYNYGQWYCLIFTTHQVSKLYVNFPIHKHQAYVRPLFALSSALKHLDSNELANKSLVNLSLEPI